MNVSPTVSVRVTVEAGLTAVAVTTKKFPAVFTQEGVVMLAVLDSLPTTQVLTRAGGVPELAVTVAVAAPLKATDAPAPLADTFPQILHVGPPTTVKFTAVTLPLLTVTCCEVGVNETPVFEGVTV